MSVQEILLDQARTVVFRLERISADSNWAHRSSGCRGALLKWIERIDQNKSADKVELSSNELDEVKKLIGTGYEYLEKAAREGIRRS